MISKIINLTALCYASWKIYWRYQEIGKSVPETFVHKIFGYARPIQLLTNRGSFFIDSGGIILETMLYKTLAQLILLCASSDILELFESAISRGKRVARALLI
ncbi:MAG TPA: hypothetical protein VFF04_03430 [Candidatus Babeliales bacterium]|nr:hypothetical protein [Candidatus Babeliales bacterium]